MSVSGIASSGFLQYGTTGPLMQPSSRQSEDLIGRTLEQDLQNGDLAGAQQAYNQLAAYGPNNSGPFNGNPTLAAEFKQVGQDLQSGNLTAAKSDTTTLTNGLLRQDIQAVVRASKNGTTQDASMAGAIANLKGDYWAVYGQQPTEAQVQALEGSSTPINIQA